MFARTCAGTGLSRRPNDGGKRTRKIEGSSFCVYAIFKVTKTGRLTGNCEQMLNAKMREPMIRDIRILSNSNMILNATIIAKVFQYPRGIFVITPDVGRRSYASKHYAIRSRICLKFF